MAEDAEKLSGAEEFVAAEIELSTLLDPEQERNLLDALEKMGPEALESFDISPKKISLCYDPARTSKDDLLTVIRQAGAQLKNVASEESPLIQ